MTEPLANLDSVSEVYNSMARVSGRERNTSKSSNRANITRFNYSRSRSMPDCQCNISEVEQLRAASVSSICSTGMPSFSNPSASELSQCVLSSGTQSGYIYRDHDIMNVPNVLPYYYSGQNAGTRACSVYEPAW